MLPFVWGLSEEVDVPAGCYAAAELAQRLSHGEVKVSIDGALADRGFAVRLRKRSFPEVDRLLSEAAGVRLVSMGDQKWRLEPDSEADKLDRRLFVQYTAKIDTVIHDAVQAAIAIAGPNLPPKLSEVQDGLRKRYQFSNAPTRGLEIALDDKPGPESEKNGWRLLAGLAGSAAFICSVTPPAFEWARQGGTVETLIRQDVWLSGDLAAWQENPQLALWARNEALENLRLEAERLAGDSSLDANERQRQLALVARSTLRVHRLHFEPRDGRFWTETGWMDGRTFGGRMTYAQPFFFAPGLSVALLRSITRSKPDADRLEARLQSTQSLSGDLAAEDVRNLSERALRYAESHDRDVVVEIQPVRELCVGNRVAPLLGNDSPSERGHPFNAGTRFWQFPAATPAFTAQIVDGALVLRDEWKFLDRKYRIPMADALALRRKVAACRSMTEVAQVAAKAKKSTVEAALFSGFELGNGFTENWPILCAIASMKPSDFTSVSDSVANELVTRLRRWHQISIAASSLPGANRMNVLMPINVSQLRILPGDSQGTARADLLVNSVQRGGVTNGITWIAVFGTGAN